MSNQTSSTVGSALELNDDGEKRLTGRQWTDLSISTMAFTVNFAVWTLFSIIGIEIQAELNLSNREFGLLIATPILSGCLTRIPLGMLVERLGGRLVFFLQMLTVAGSTYGIIHCQEYWQFLVIGLLVGLAGSSFSIGMTHCAPMFDKSQQNWVISFFGLGNLGAALSNIITPLLLLSFGWRKVPELYAIAVTVMAILFLLFARSHKHATGPKALGNKTLNEILQPLKELRVWRFGLYYYFSFGGFIALALWLPKYYVDEYQLSILHASLLTLFFTLPSGLLRAVGGSLSDRYGAREVNWGVFWICMICLFFLSYPPTSMTIHGIEREIPLFVHINVWVFTLLICVMSIAMGFGKASVYRLVHQYYPDNSTGVTGLVSVLGGLGGFSLPILFGLVVDITGIRTSCFMLLYGILGLCMVWMHYAIKSSEHLERIQDAINSDFLKE